MLDKQEKHLRNPYNQNKAFCFLSAGVMSVSWDRQVLLHKET